MLARGGRRGRECEGVTMIVKKTGNEKHTNITGSKELNMDGLGREQHEIHVGI